MHIFKFIVPRLSLQKWFVRSDYESNIVGTRTQNISENASNWMSMLVASPDKPVQRDPTTHQ